jgi:sulfonate dioxygenase
MLRLVRTPETGGDTIFTSQVALFDKLSPHFQKLFEGLKGVHSSEHSYQVSLNRGVEPFRAPVRREHPLVNPTVPCYYIGGSSLRNRFARIL